MRKIVSCMILALLLASSLTLTFNVGLVHAQAETVTINSDGSVSPSSAPISSVDNITYRLTSDVINGSIVVQRDDIVIDGAGYTVQGAPSTPNSVGIDLTGRSKVTVENANIRSFYYGIYLQSSSNNIVGGNNITSNDYSIWLSSSSNNTMSGNN